MPKEPYNKQNKEHNDTSKYKVIPGTVFQHAINALNASPKDYILRWSILLHDIGKPSVRMVKDGRIRHPGHEKASVDMADKILRKYKFDNKTREQVLWIIKNHGFGMSWKNMSEYKKKKLVSHPLFDKLIQHYEADRRSSEDDIITKEALEDIKAYKDYTERFQSDTKRWEQMKKFTLINGKDLTVSPFQFKGRTISKVLEDVKEKYIIGTIKNRKEALEYIKNSHWKKYILSNLKINGKDLIDKGMEPGPELGKTLQDVAQKVYNNELPNERNALISYLDSLEI